MQSQLGSVSLRMVSEGEALRPFAAFPQDNEDAGRRASMAIFRAHHHLLRISRKRGENIVIIQVHEPEGKTARKALLALSEGIPLAFLMKATIPDPGGQAAPHGRHRFLCGHHFHDAGADL